MKVSVKTLLKICISLGLLAFFLVNAGVEKTFRELSSANLWYLPLCVVIYLISQLISSYRWQFLARPMGFDLSLREFYDYYLMGMFFSLFLPGAIGGDVGRIYYLAKSRDRKKRDALLTILAERGVGLVALLFFTTIFCLMPSTAVIPAMLRYSMIGLTAFACISYVVLRLLPMQQLANRYSFLALIAQAEIYWKDIPLLFRSVSVSMLVHGCMVFVHYLITLALGIQVPLEYLAAVYGMVGLASVLPIFFNGLGVREGSYTYLLGKIGVVSQTGFAFAIYWFTVSALTSLVGGLILAKGHYKTPTFQSNVTNEQENVPV